MFTEGQPTKVEFTVYDADGDKLTFNVLENISDYQLSSGSFTWTPSARDLSLDLLHITVSDGMATDTLQQKIRFASKKSQDISASFATSTLYDATFSFVIIHNPLLTNRNLENILIRNKRTGYKILLPCDKVADDLFRGRLVLSQDEYRFIPVREGDIIEMNYQYDGITCTDYAVSSSGESKGFRLDPNDIAALNGAQYFYDETDIPLVDILEPSLLVYPNPNAGEFTIHCEGLKGMAGYRISIHDLQGKVIYSTQDICQGDILHRKISISNVAKGNCLIKLVAVDKAGKNIYAHSTKMIIQ